MPNLIRWLFSISPLFLSTVFGRFLGSEGTALITTSRDLVLFAFFVLILIYLFRRYVMSLRKKYGILFFIFLSISVLVFIYTLFFLLRVYLVSHFSDALWALVIMYVVSGGGGQPLPLPASSALSSSSSYTEDSFEINVLLEEEIIRNISFETSLHNRVIQLEHAASPFLNQEGPGQFWAIIQNSLDQADSQRDYNKILEFENRDLQIRERQHSCYLQFNEILINNPNLIEGAPYNPQSCLVDFLLEKRENIEITHSALSPNERDQEELNSLELIFQDLVQQNPHSPCLREILKF